MPGRIPFVRAMPCASGAWERLLGCPVSLPVRYPSRTGIIPGMHAGKSEPLGRRTMLSGRIGLLRRPPPINRDLDMAQVQAQMLDGVRQAAALHAVAGRVAAECAQLV